jgi:hypothetical protein
MNASKVFRAIVFLVLTSAACSSILGMEDIHEDPKPGGEGGEGANGGSTGNRGGSAGATNGGATNGGNAGSSMTGGRAGSTSNGGASSGSAGDGGEGDMGGGDSGGSSNGGSAGSGGTPDPTVRGKLVSTFLQPIPNTTVFLTDPESGDTLGQADTDADGEFVIPDVADEYDAKFVLNYEVFNNIYTYAWVYQGLTRRDPTLQVYNGLTRRSGNYSADPNDLTATSFDNLRLAMGIGGPDGLSFTSISLPNGIGQSSIGWQGPATTNVTAHVLLMELDANDIPTAYQSYDQQLEVFSESVPATLVFSVPNEVPPIASGIIAGTITSPTADERYNYAFLRFDSNAAIDLIEESGSGTSDPFSFFVPTIAGASIEIGGTEGYWAFGEAACAHRDRLAVGQSNVAIAIPTPPQQVAPTTGITNVNGSTIFSWTSSAKTFVLFLDNIEDTSPYGGMFIVTSEKQATIPSFPNGFTLIPGDEYNWRVETHRSWMTMDELAGPEGFADSWAPYCESPESPLRGDGQYAISFGRTFFLAE